MARSFSSSVSTPSSSASIDRMVLAEQVKVHTDDATMVKRDEHIVDSHNHVIGEVAITTVDVDLSKPHIEETINEIEVDGVITKEVTTTTTTTTTTTDVLAREASSSSSSSSSEHLPPNVRRVTRKVERQAPRLMHHEEYVVEGAGNIIKEYEFEEQVAVEYTGVREDVVEHIVAIPVTSELVSRDFHAEATRIVEVERPVPVIKVVEVPQVEIIEQLREVPTPSGRIAKKYNYCPKKKIVPQEKKIIVERPVERIVEIDDITYVDTEEIIETIEVPEYQDVIKIQEKKVATVIEVPYEVIEEVDDISVVDVLIPVGVEAETKVVYNVPTIVEKRHAKGYPVYVPRFIEAPTSSIHLSKEQRTKSKALLTQLKELENSMKDGNKIVSACEIEKMGVAARDHQTCIQGHIDSSDLKKSLIDVFGRSDSTVTDASKKKKTNEGYYGHANVIGQWNNIAYEKDHHSKLSVSTRSVSSRHSSSL